MNFWKFQVDPFGIVLIPLVILLVVSLTAWYRAAKNEIRMKNIPTETEWRLACIIMPALHKKPDGSVIAWKRKVDSIGKTVRVREYRGSLVRAWDCGAKRFFEIHPEDARAQWDSPYKFLVTCEHNLEIAGEEPIKPGGIETQYAPF